MALLADVHVNEPHCKLLSSIPFCWIDGALILVRHAAVGEWKDALLSIRCCNI